jgi:hypothetical protein
VVAALPAKQSADHEPDGHRAADRPPERSTSAERRVRPSGRRANRLLVLLIVAVLATAAGVAAAYLFDQLLLG